MNAWLRQLHVRTKKLACFINVWEENSFKIRTPLNPISLEKEIKSLVAYIGQILQFYAENVRITRMRKMKKLVNYAIVHHHILSDALWNWN